MPRRTGWYTGYWNHWRGRLLDFAARQGLHIMPVHFYTPIPEVSRLADGRRGPERPDPTGISLRTGEAMGLLERLAAAYGEGNPRAHPGPPVNVLAGRSRAPARN